MLSDLSRNLEIPSIHNGKGHSGKTDQKTLAIIFQKSLLNAPKRLTTHVVKTSEI